MNPCTRCNGSGTEPPLADWERELLDEKQRAEFLATHQHMLINSLEIAALSAGTPELRDHYAKAAADMKKVPCPECPFEAR